MPEHAAGSGASGRLVLVAGATSTSGHAATRALVGAGARVVAVGRDAAKLAPLAEYAHAGGDVRTEVADLADEGAVVALAQRLRDAGERIDGVLHLVGGWCGGGGLPGQTDDDYRFLEASLTALRFVTRTFWDDLLAADAARVAIVSSTAVARPLAGGANYAAVKAASEAWTRAVAQGFAKAARYAAQAEAPGGAAQAKAPGGAAQRAAATIFRVKSLAGEEKALAEAYIGLWNADAADVNDTIIDL